MKTYRYLYYRLFCKFQKSKNHRDIAKSSAISFITLLNCINIITIPFVINDIANKEIIQFPNLTSPRIKAYVILFFFILSFFNYFILCFRKKHNDINEEFKNESSAEKKVGSLNIILYIFVSLSILIISALPLWF